MAKAFRLDVLILERGLLPSRQIAQAAIMDGGVLVNGQKVTKPGTATAADAKIDLVGNWRSAKYVSRGGLKLERALNVFAIDATDRICLDLGASTGGFTDCLLQHGARLVYAIDVGHGQLAWSLRQNPRVVVKEKINARHLAAADLYEAAQSERASLLVADLSFISITKVLPNCLALLNQDRHNQVVALIKPQFEAGKEAVGKGGVIKAPETHLQVLEDTVRELAKQGLSLQGLTYSPIKGPAGNIEFLGYWHLSGESRPLDLTAIVTEAHAQLQSIAANKK